MDSDQNRKNSNLRNSFSKWWFLIAVVSAWVIISVWPKGQSSADLPYSVFINQVQAGNVTKVRLAGTEITGNFVQPVLWPVPAASIVSTPVTGEASVQNPSISYSTFNTRFPDAVGDSTLMPLLVTHHVEITVTQSTGSLLITLFSFGLPLLMLVVFILWLSRNSSSGQSSGVFSFIRSRARQVLADRPDVTFKDVSGMDEVKIELEEVVDFLKNPKKYHDLGARIPRGILLVGPPGTGKTLLARAVSGEAKVPFFSISASEFVEMFVGVGASRVRDLFEQVKKVAPGIVFIDELDAVGRRRGAGPGTVNDEREQTLNQLLVEMDGFDVAHDIIILAATNRPDVLDPALLRPGRFDRQVTVGLPDRIGREGILQIHSRKLTLAQDVSLSLLARITTGFSGADLANLCNEAALVAARKNHLKVEMIDFEDALDRLLLGAARILLLNDHDRLVVAYHEAGHALVAWLTLEADPVHKVTIIPRGRALGVTEQVPGEDHYNYSKEYLLARLTVMLGGRSAEEIAIGQVTTGAENDLVQATRLARRMVTRWGMGGLGLMALSSDEEQPFLGYELTQQRDYSEETAARIDRDVRMLLDEQHQIALHLLTDNREKLDALVKVLLHDETIDGEVMTKVIGPRVFETAEPKLPLKTEQLSV